MNRKVLLRFAAVTSLAVACYVVFSQISRRITVAKTSSAMDADPRVLEKSPMDSVRTIQRVTPQSVSYSTAKNINAYITSLTAKPSPPGAFEVASAKAWNECGSLIARPNSAAIQISQLQSNGGKYAEFRIKALQQIESRCKDFAFSTRLTRSGAEALFADAARKGNAEALARGLVSGLAAMPPNEARETVMSIIGSNDPAALFTLADAFGENGPFEISPGGEVGTPNARYAWQLVACDHGMDCSASSTVVQNSCLGIGLCGPGDYRASIGYSALSPGDYQQVVEIENRINTAISNGTVQSYFNHK